MAIRLRDLAGHVGGRVEGDGEHEVSGVRPLAEAAAEHLSLLNHARYRAEAEASGAGALLTTPALAAQLPARSAGSESADRNLLLVDDVSFALATVLGLLHPERERPPGVAPSAIVDPSAEVDPSAWIGPYVVIDAGSRIGARAAVHPFVAIGRDCTVGQGAILYPHAVLYDRTEIGAASIVHAGAVIGSDGFGYATQGGIHHKVPQVGRAVVEEEVEIGANTTIDRATLGETRIGRGTKVDNLVQVGHNVRVGERSILCGQAGIAGSTELGRYVVLAGQVGVSGHLEVADGTQVAAKSAVLRSVEEKGRQIGGIPAGPIAEWRRQAAATARLPESIRRQNDLMRRVERIEKRLDALGRSEEGEE
ncbi:MAG TPA: UDP-3-O-(3-hydroxymyristoyl)glucosamine N-acyltransferase [Thermoanaerobaculia bacterium]|nr:UDP-3-O-(3-hydroxymyristoyl)glucosamine N-acyltransferase [Thermoanaerobaculia bacterium]